MDHPKAQTLLKTAVIAIAIAVSACSSEAEEGFPRDFATTAEASNAVPAEIRTDFDALMSCQGDVAVAAGQGVPELSVDRVADLVDTIQADPMAVEKCIQQRNPE